MTSYGNDEKTDDDANQEEGAPEEKVGDGDDEEHLHSRHPLPVDPLQVVLNLAHTFESNSKKYISVLNSKNQP